MPEASKSKTKSKSIPTAMVIGGAGFIGSYVCESLLAQNLKVIAIDDLSSGKEDYIEPLKNDKSFQFIKLDVDQTPLPDFPDVQYIFHIGGVESYINGVDLTLKTMLVNSVGTYNILELARKNNAQLLLASSLDIYGGVLSSLSMNNYFGQSERDAKKYTHHEAKRYAEALVIEYYRKYELDARIVRVADVYGPRMDLTSGSEIASLFQEAINTDGLTVHGDGLKILHPSYIADVVAGVTKAMFTQNTKGKIYNITSHEEINVLNFAYTIQKNSTKPLRIQFTQEYKEVKFPIHPAEIQQTESELAWNAKTKLAEGVTQTLEYFFLKLPKEKTITKKAEMPSKIKEIPKELTPSPTSSILLENMQNKEVKPITNTIKNEPLSPAPTNPDKEDKKNPTHGKVNKLNALILSTSLFIVLTLFLFPLYALYSSSTAGIKTTQDALSQETTESVINAQKNIYYGNVQYDNLEWFFNTIQKRNSFENSRTALQSLDRLNTAIGIQNKLKSTTLNTVNALMSGTATQKQIITNKELITASFLNVQNATIETEAAKSKLAENSETLFTKASNDILAGILTQAPITLENYSHQSTTIQNLIQFLSPAQNKAYLITLHDTVQQNAGDPKILGYAYVQLSSNGITKITHQKYTYKTEGASLSDSLKDIIESNKQSGWLPLNAIFATNTNVLKDIVISQGSITSAKLAQIINGNNIEEKIQQNRANSEFQYNIWNEVINNLTLSDNAKLEKLGLALYKSIQNDDIKMIAQDAKSNLIFPSCDTDRVLQKDFNNNLDSAYPNKNNGLMYCIAVKEKQISLQQNNETQKKITVEANQLDEVTNHIKLSYKIKNNTKTAFNSDVTIQVPGAPVLTNLQLVFPLSLDKARIDKKENQTAYTINIALDPSSEKELIIEWDTKNSDANINKSGIYLSKPFGSVIESSTITINKKKPISATFNNSDAYLF